MTPLVVVPCSGAKRTYPDQAQFLYTGSLFTMALTAAERLTRKHRIAILSARHGFVRLTDRLEPYDTSWADPEAADHTKLLVTAGRFNVNGDPVALLLPRAYACRALRVWPNALTPLADCRGIGEMKHRLRLLATGDHEL